MNEIEGAPVETEQEEAALVSSVADAPPDVQYRLSDHVHVFADTTIESEMIGALRTQIVSQHIKAGRRALTICSPNAGAGATFVAVNLAVSLAQARVKTLVIDANMRSPDLYRFIAPSREVPGLHEYLSEETADLGDVIQENVLPSLSVIFAGKSAGNAQELLASPRLKTLVDMCMREYDITIFDTPPSNSCADAQLVATLARYGMIVVRKNMSYVNDVKTLISEMAANRVQLIGTVINDM